MKKITFLLLTFFAFAFSNAQEVVNDENYESFTVGDPIPSTTNQLEKGTATAQIATASGNTTTILKAIHDSGQNDMFIRSKSFGVSEGDVINTSFDIATSNTVHVVTIRCAIGDDFTTAVAFEPDVAATSTTGAQGGAPLGRMVTTANEFGTTSAIFTIPAGFNTARVQIYNFGSANTVELDNFLVTKTSSLSTADLSQFNFKSYPNPAKDVINLSAAKNINKIAIYNLLGQEVLNQELNSKTATLNVASFARGVYVVKADIEGAVGSYKFIKE